MSEASVSIDAVGININITPVALDIEAGTMVPGSSLSVTENGTYYPAGGTLFSEVIVDVPSGGGGAPLQSASVTFDYWQFLESVEWSTHAEEKVD